MEPKPVRNSTPPFAEVSADLRIRPFKAVMVQERSLRMVTSLVTSPVTSSASSNTASTSEMPCRGVGDTRIMSPLLCGSPGSGGVLIWASVPARPLVHGSELQPELQPRPCLGLGSGAWRSGRFTAPGQCTSFRGIPHSECTSQFQHGPRLLVAGAQPMTSTADIAAPRFAAERHRFGFA